jgi:hypothetical protein
MPIEYQARWSSWVNPSVSVPNTMHAVRAHLVNIVPFSSWTVEMLPKPMPLNLHLESALYDRIASEFGQRTLREFVNLSKKARGCQEFVTFYQHGWSTNVRCNAVLFQQRLLWNNFHGQKRWMHNTMVPLLATYFGEVELKRIISA